MEENIRDNVCIYRQEDVTRLRNWPDRWLAAVQSRKVFKVMHVTWVITTDFSII